MKLLGTIALLAGASGCFYFESINERPSVQIRALAADPVYRGAVVQLRADYADPENDYVSFTWRAYACVDATVFETCAQAPFTTSATNTFDVTVPSLLPDTSTPTRSLRIVLEAQDEYGATARPQDELIIPVLDALPTIEVRKFSSYQLVVGTPIDIYAKIGDADDPADQLTVAWEVFHVGSTAPFTFVDNDPPIVIDEADPEHPQHVKVLVPQATGTWQVKATVSDPLAATDATHAVAQLIEIEVVDDGAPCLAQLQPNVPPTGAALPLSAPTLFRVPVVKDDLDPYPLIPDDAIFGAPRFQWSLQASGGSTHVDIAGATSNSLALDPASYTPGDVLEVRVQIYDRKNTALPCPDSEATCSTVSLPNCLQRQTWRVEIR